MAVRFRKDRLRWQVYWKNPFTGKQESAFYATEKEARKADDQIKYRLKWEKESFRPTDKPEEEQTDDSLGAIDFLYLQRKRFGEKRLQWHVSCMEVPLELLGSKRVSAITTRDLSMVIDALTRRKKRLHGKELPELLAVTTVRDRMRRLYTVLRWALKQGYVEHLPMLPELPSGEYGRIQPPTPEEVNAILANAAPHIQRVVVLGAKLGMRVGPSELLKLTWADVDLERGIVRVPAARKNKREPWREVPIKNDILRLFRVWKEQDDMQGMTHVIHWHGHPVKALGRAWHRALERAGITRRIRPYDLRHAFATDALRAEKDVGTVAKLMGHSSPEMVLRTYQHVVSAQKKETVEALPSIDNSFLQYALPGMPNSDKLPLQ